jgi:hypothetical protein
MHTLMDRLDKMTGYIISSISTVLVVIVAALGFSQAYGRLTGKFDAHVQRDDERFNEQREMLAEMRADIKELLHK